MIVICILEVNRSDIKGYHDLELNLTMEYGLRIPSFSTRAHLGILVDN